MGEERELKLEFRPGDLARLKRSPLFGASGDRICETLDSTYFDTPKRKLARAGYTLRVRRKGEGFVQTLKAKAQSSVGTHVRDEWEWPLIDQTPDLSLLHETPAARRFRKRSRLVPLFETRVERTTRVVKRDGAEVELALDEGTVVAGGRSAPIHSLELELKSGPSSALYALARQFPKTASLDLDVRSKSERGFALLDPEAPTSFKAEPIALQHDGRVGAAAQAVLKSCLRQFRLNVPGVLAQGEPEALHQARVAVRRCRSALSFFAPVLADADFGRHKAKLGDLSRTLGAARDLDVFLATDHPAPLQAKAEAERDRRYARLRTLLTSAAHREDLLALAAWIEHGAWQAPDMPEPAIATKTFAAARFDLWRRKVKSKGRDLAALAPHDRHQARIAAKKLRYACEFLATGVSGKRQRKRFDIFVDALEALQEALGDLNDLAFGHALHDEFDRTTPANGHDPDPPRTEARDETTLIERADRAYHAFCDAKPFWA